MSNPSFISNLNASFTDKLWLKFRVRRHIVRQIKKITVIQGNDNFYHVCAIPCLEIVTNQQLVMHTYEPLLPLLAMTTTHPEHYQYPKNNDNCTSSELVVSEVISNGSTVWATLATRAKIVISAPAKKVIKLKYTKSLSRPTINAYPVQQKFPLPNNG